MSIAINVQLTSYFFPIVSLIIVQEMKPQIIPCVIEYVRGIRIIAKKAGNASSKFFQFILSTGPIMNAPIRTRAGAVAIAGTTESRGEKNINGRKRSPDVTAVIPVLPPSSTPVADSI